MRMEETPMSIQPFSRTNRAVQSLPKHLLQFAVDQRYEEYTPVDHAVWRFIMRQNIFFLKEYAHRRHIVNEVAGHALINVYSEYSIYLQRFGEVGAKAMQSCRDFELYQAIRHLSILKELPNSDPKEVEEATREVERRQKNLGEPSEMALLSRLHWWTVEYGLIGTLDKPKIY